MNIRQALLMAQHALLGSDSAQIDAEVLLCSALDKPRSHLYAWPEQALGPAQHSRFEALLERRILGEPVAYITGVREFWSLSLQVNPQVLIPRSETEVLVEQALALLQTPQALVADLGTGSGAIALALATERPGWQLVATDASAAALAVASDNRIRLGLGNVTFREGRWCDALPAGSYDMIVSNPPYIEPDDVHLGQGDLRFEPRSALVADDGGLADLRSIAAQALSHLRPGGWLLLEHGWQQGAGVREILERLGYREVGTIRDLSGNERISLGCRV